MEDLRQQHRHKHLFGIFNQTCGNPLFTCCTTSLLSSSPADVTSNTRPAKGMLVECVLIFCVNCVTRIVFVSKQANNISTLNKEITSSVHLFCFYNHFLSSEPLITLPSFARDLWLLTGGKSRSFAPLFTLDWISRRPLSSFEVLNHLSSVYHFAVFLTSLSSFYILPFLYSSQSVRYQFIFRFCLSHDWDLSWLLQDCNITSRG